MRAFKVWYRCLRIAFILMFVFQAASHAEHENAAYCYRCCVVCVSQCLSDTTRSPTKTAEPIQLPFGMWTRIDTKKACISRGSGSPTGTDTFGRLARACPHLPAVDALNILNVIRQAAAAMRPLAARTIAVEVCIFVLSLQYTGN